MGTHVNPWLIHVNVWQKLLQYCKAISLQLIKMNEKKKKREREKSLSEEGTLLLLAYSDHSEGAQELNSSYISSFLPFFCQQKTRVQRSQDCGQGQQPSRAQNDEGRVDYIPRNRWELFSRVCLFN